MSAAQSTVSAAAAGVTSSGLELHAKSVSIQYIQTLVVIMYIVN